MSRASPLRLVVVLAMAWAQTYPTINLMTEDALGDFAEEDWEGYACPFLSWATCVNTTTTCNDVHAACRACTSKLSGRNIACADDGPQRVFFFPPGGVFPITEQFTLPRHTAIVGAADPNAADDPARQQTDVAAHTWFVVPRSASLCGDDPRCANASARAPTACSGDPATHRPGFLMSTGSTLANVSYQGADLGRAASEGTLCGPGAIELPGCLSGDGCAAWGPGATTGTGVVRDVTVRNVRLSDAVKRARVAQMRGDCATGEALDADGGHVRAHQVSVWVAKLPDAERGAHANVSVDGLVSMNSRADGLNVHGAVDGFALARAHLENTGDDCVGVWSARANASLRDVTLKNCAVTAGAQTNWGSCVGTYAFAALAVDGLACYDPFADATGCPPRTHYSAVHVNRGFASDCMPPAGATLALARVEYFASAAPATPLDRPKCAQCESCCGACSAEGFGNLRVEYVDGSVPAGSCKSEDAGCATRQWGTSEE